MITSSLFRERLSIFGRWNWVSTLFVLVRYLGLCWAILSGSTFVPGPVKVGTTLTLLGCWVFPAFLAAANLVMILHVYAMWNQSKRILCPPVHLCAAGMS
ncbi:hypothetical protein HD554DRAFT_676315 [Boletus coccyginus]|nr:hypothetical protein HD554DRAFT_676315 [Boletus coccyginus]